MVRFSIKFFIHCLVCVTIAGTGWAEEALPTDRQLIKIQTAVQISEIEISISDVYPPVTSSDFYAPGVELRNLKDTFKVPCITFISSEFDKNDYRQIRSFFEKEMSAMSFGFAQRVWNFGVENLEDERKNNLVVIVVAGVMQKVVFASDLGKMRSYLEKLERAGSCIVEIDLEYRNNI